MYIDEIPANSKITIEFNYVTKATKLETTVKKAGTTGKAGKCVIFIDEIDAVGRGCKGG